MIRMFEKIKCCSMVTLVGWLACVMAVGMYLSYIDQIYLNLSGQPGSIILPTLTVFNCVFWVLYGLLKEVKDWPIVVCNAPGIVFGIITILTAV